MNISDHLTEPEQAELVRWCAGVDPLIEETNAALREAGMNELSIGKTVTRYVCGALLTLDGFDYLSDLNAAARILRAVISTHTQAQEFGRHLRRIINISLAEYHKICTAPAWAICLAAKRAVESEGGR